ncbi:hypothetical protein [Nonomuraea sp. NPDC049784]|uniref:hypothetical protein n=1 Tax=Nonomuraea sp. NPDC049784 TaxID=3154361 RepID=UPI003400FB36
MLIPTVHLLDKTYINLLELLVRDGDHTLPAGTTRWGLRAVHRDPDSGERYSKYGFVYPAPGGWAEAPGPIVESNHEGFPRRVGDGLCLSTTELDPEAPLWHGMANSKIPADDLLLVAYHDDDVLGIDPWNGTMRVRRMFVVADIDGVSLIIQHGAGAYLTGVEVSDAQITNAAPVLMAGATWAEVQAVVADRIDLRWYARVRQAGASDEQVRDALRQFRQLQQVWQHDYARCLEAGGSHDEILAAASAGIPLGAYHDAREAGASHREMLAISDDLDDIYEYIFARISGVSDSRYRAARKAGVDWYDYDDARKAGASDRRVRRARRLEFYLPDYARALRAGAKDRQVRAAHRAGIDVGDYALAREAGLTDQEVQAALHIGRNVVEVANERLHRYAPTFADELPF